MHPVVSRGRSTGQGARGSFQSYIVLYFLGGIVEILMFTVPAKDAPNRVSILANSNYFKAAVALLPCKI